MGSGRLGFTHISDDNWVFPFPVLINKHKEEDSGIVFSGSKIA